MRTDYPEAIPYWAHPTNYRTGGVNTPRGWVLHTPEEPADNYPGTAYYFAQPNRDASTHYFVSYTGVVYQCVPEKYLAIANGVVGKPYPSWADARQSLNWQSLSVEIEGYAASIHQTLTVGGRQWDALVRLIRHRAKAYGIPLDRAHIIGHYEVANNRSDPGLLFPWDALLAALKEEKMPTQEYSELYQRDEDIKTVVGMQKQRIDQLQHLMKLVIPLIAKDEATENAEIKRLLEALGG